MTASGNDPLPEPPDVHEVRLSRASKREAILFAVGLGAAAWIFFFLGEHQDQDTPGYLVIWTLGVAAIAVHWIDPRPLLRIDRSGIRFRVLVWERAMAWSELAAMNLWRWKTEGGSPRVVLDLLPTGSRSSVLLARPRILFAAGGFALTPGGWQFMVDLPFEEEELGLTLAAIERLALADLPRNWSWSEDGTKVEIHPPG